MTIFEALLASGSHDLTALRLPPTPSLNLKTRGSGRVVFHKAGPKQLKERLFRLMVGVRRQSMTAEKAWQAAGA